MGEAPVTNDTPLTPVENVSASDDALSAAYDLAMSSSEPDAPEAAEAAARRDEQGRFAKQNPAEASPQDGEAGEEAQAAVSDRPAIPAGLPATWRADMADIWEAVPEDKRERLGKWSQEVNAKLSDMGRKVSAYSDVQSVFDDMLQTYPDRFNGPDAMHPKDAVKFLYQVQKDMDARPVETILEVAARYNAIPELAKALGGAGYDQNAQVSTLQGTIQQLEARIASLVSPETINNHISRAMSEREVTSSLERFASEKPFFGDVESVLPQFINIARESEPEADPMRLLETAYDMAINAIPAVREKAQAASRAAVMPDARAAAAKKAASINVKSTAAGRPKPRSEEEAMGDVWDRMHSS
jgi:hypothetical protein